MDQKKKAFKFAYCKKFTLNIPQQLQVHLENIALHLIEDRPSANITSPGSLPIDLAIPTLTLTRDKTGLFSIQPSGMKN